MRHWYILGAALALGCAMTTAGCGSSPPIGVDPEQDGGTGDGGAGARGTLIISEVVPYPTNDWNRTSGGGAPYQGEPGTGLVSSIDEFIELQNVGPDPVDLTGWYLEIRGGETVITEIGVHGVLVLSPGSLLTSVQPGAFVVIGDPEGSMSTDVYIMLRDADGELVDDVEIGGLSESRDRKGDGPGNGAPSPDLNGFARGSFDEAIARPDGQPRTGNDQADFDKMHATPLAPNRPLPVPVETDPPSVVASASGQRFRVTDLLWFELDEAVDPHSTDTTIRVLAGGQEIPLGFTTFEKRDHRVVINPIGRLPYDTDLTVEVLGGPGGVTDRAGNPLPGSYTFSVRTEPAPPDPGPVLINEICATAVQDWSNSAGGDRVPFSTQPGTGLVNSTDEWVELLVRREGPVNLTHYTLDVYNGPNIFGPTREFTPLSSQRAIIYVTGTGLYLSAAQEGDRVIIGDPHGSIHNDAFLALRDENGDLVDTVEIGGNAPETDRGGDGVRNGAPGPGLNGNATGLHDETIARWPDGHDTGDDAGDFVHSYATLGAEN